MNIDKEKVTINRSAPDYEAECKQLYEENIKLQRKIDGLIIAIQAITVRGDKQ